MISQSSQHKLIQRQKSRNWVNIFYEIGNPMKDSTHWVFSFSHLKNIFSLSSVKIFKLERCLNKRKKVALAIAVLLLEEKKKSVEFLNKSLHILVLREVTLSCRLKLKTCNNQGIKFQQTFPASELISVWQKEIMQTIIRKQTLKGMSWSNYLPRLLTSQGKTMVSAVGTRHLFPVVMKDGVWSNSGTDFEDTVNENKVHQHHEVWPASIHTLLVAITFDKYCR